MIGCESQEKKIERLVGQLGDKNWKARFETVTELVEIGKPAVPALTKALGDENQDVSWGAAWAFEGIGEPAWKAVPALIKALGDEHESVRSSAASALGKIGTLEAMTAVESWRRK